MPLRYVKSTPLSLKRHPFFRESWLRDRIAEDPAVLGLGPLQLKEAERRQPDSGRLDLLLERGIRRYVLELTLGAVDESHILRCIEYWDSERRRFPHYEHCAVLVAEDITPRMLHVLHLLLRHFPMLVLKVDALGVGCRVLLHFTRVLATGWCLESPAEAVLSRRERWVVRSSMESVALAEECVAVLREFDPEARLLFHEDGVRVLSPRAPGLVRFRPGKRVLRVELRTGDREDFCQRCPAADIAPLAAGWRWSNLQFILQPGDLAAKAPALRRALAAAMATSAGLPRSLPGVLPPLGDDTAICP